MAVYVPPWLASHAGKERNSAMENGRAHCVFDSNTAALLSLRIERGESATESSIQQLHRPHWPQIWK